MVRGHGVSSCVDELMVEAIERGVSPAVAGAAQDATRRFAQSCGRATVGRQRAYFWAVVRRRSLRRADSRAVTERLMVESVVQDLMSSGREPGQIWEDLQRGWRDSVSEEVLETYRLRLSA